MGAAFDGRIGRNIMCVRTAAIAPPVAVELPGRAAINFAGTEVSGAQA
jgi:hypothetical protein